MRKRNFIPVITFKEGRMKRILPYCVGVAAIYSALAAAGSAISAGALPLPDPQDKVSQAALPEILKATGEYCELVKRMAFDFVCLERIREQENFFTRGSGASRSTPDALKVTKAKTRTFIYEYQIIKVKEDIREKRNLMEEDGRKRYQENADLPTLKFSARNLVYGPVGFFSRTWQPYFSYEILGEEEVGGKRAIVVRAVPSTEREENNNHGRVWVDASNYRILRLELEPQIPQSSEVDIETKNAEEAAMLLGRHGSSTNVKFHRRLTWTIDFGVEKKGALFPSRQTIREWYVSDMGFRIVKREVTFDYTDYKYFTVEVDVR